MIALGFLCELSLDRRRWVMTILAAGLAVSHAAGGLLCLAAGLVFTLGRRNLARAVVFAVLAAAVIFLLRDTQSVQCISRATNHQAKQVRIAA
jgi:predicted membrane-bound dolichyl-phosphate-mannose-protein mannosyltransferase